MKPCLIFSSENRKHTQYTVEATEFVTAQIEMGSGKLTIMSVL